MSRISEAPDPTEAAGDGRDADVVDADETPPAAIVGRAAGEAAADPRWQDSRRDRGESRDVALPAATPDRAQRDQAPTDGIARLRALADLTRSLIQATTIEGVADSVLTTCLVATGADAGGFFILDEAGHALVAASMRGYDEVSERALRRWSLDRPSGLAEAVHLREARYAERLEEWPASWRDGRAIHEANAMQAGAVVPILGEDALLGVIALSFRQPHRFVPEEHALLLALGGAAAQALDRARLQAARERAAAIARIRVATAEAETLADAGDRLLAELRTETAAVNGRLVVVDDETATLLTVSAFGYPADVLDGVRVQSLDATFPVADAIRSGSAAFYEQPLLDQRYPTHAPVARSLGVATVVVLPLLARGRISAAVRLGLPAAGDVDASSLPRLTELANAGAEAVERARLRERERAAHRMLETVVASVPIGVSVAGPDGQILFHNAAVERIWRGYRDVGALMDYRWYRGFHPDGRPYAPAEWPLVRALAGESIQDEEVEIVRFDGTRTVVSHAAAPVVGDDGRRIGAVVALTDTGPRREAQAVRDAFIGILSHELRTPVTSVVAAASLVERRRANLPPDVAGLIDDIAAESERLQRIVEDLLILARVERGVDLRRDEPVPLGHVLPRIVTLARRTWPGVSIELQLHVAAPTISGDAGYLEQILRNLIGNAAKYGDGSVRVEVRSTADEVLVAVSDDGPGIRHEEAERVFDLFYRSTMHGRSAPGAGIGLFVVRKLAEAMGGRVWIEPARTGGACVVLALRPVDADEAD